MPRRPGRDAAVSYKEVMSDDDDDEEDFQESQVSTRPARRAAAKNVSKIVDDSDEYDEDEVEEDIASDEEEEEEESVKIEEDEMEDLLGDIAPTDEMDALAINTTKRARKKPERAQMKSHDQLDGDVFEDKVEQNDDQDDDDVMQPPVESSLKIEKLIAYARRSKSEWDECCSKMNTSKVTNGRRVELLRMEEAELQAGALEEAIASAKAKAEANGTKYEAPSDHQIEKMASKIKRKKRKSAKKKTSKEETRYLVKWLRESYLHVSWETSKALKSYLKDYRLVDRHVRKLENSVSMMEEEELADLQKIDRIVDYNTFTEDSIDNENNSTAAEDSKANDILAKATEGMTIDSDEDTEDSDMEDITPPSERKASAKDGELCWEYLVKWKSQGYEDATWEVKGDIIGLENCEAAIKLFNERDSEESRLARGRVGKIDSTYRSSRGFKNGRKLRSYQVDAVNWLTFNYSNDRGSILADEMGLGKTCQTVTYIHRLRNSLGVTGPFLIVAPLATLPHWQREFEAWTDLNAITYHGSASGRELMRAKEFFWEDGKKKGPNGMPRFDALVTNYETVLSDATELRKFKWSLLVVDEAHRLKNRDSRLTVCLRETFDFAATMLLTGTPIQNSLPELWTLLNFIAPQDFESLDGFKEKYEAMTTAEAMDKFHDRLRPYMLRRIKSEVEPLPDREDTLIEVELTILQKRFYRAIYEKNTEHLMAGVEKGSRVSLNNVAMELRKCCCHPYLIDGVESKILSDNPIPPNSTNEERQAHIFGKLVESSGKLILLDKLLPKLKKEGHRVLIFSQMTRMLDILEDYLLFRQYAYERIDGSVRGVDRQFAIDRFSSSKSQSFAFLLSTRGCGQGINLTAADTVIMYDGDWNPQNDVQALARCHRIGQTKKVKVYRLITRKTYEQTMFQRASMKLGLDKAVMTGITAEASGTTKETSTRKTKSKKEQDRETERLLRYGAYALTEDQEDDADAKQFVDADIDEILSNRATVMATADADNRLSRTTFVGSEGTSLDVDDPDFWTKVVHLKKPDAKEEEMDLLERRLARRRNARVSERIIDDIDESDDDDKGAVDETPDGRKVWMKKHWSVLNLALNMYGYNRYDMSFQIINQKFPGRYTLEQVEDAIRGFLVFCALKHSNKDSGDSSDDSELSDSNEDGNEEDNSVATGSSKAVSDFTLVNMSSAQAAARIEAAFAGHKDGYVFRQGVIPDLKQGKTFTIPDVLVTRYRTRISDDQASDELIDSDSDDSDLEGEARTAKRAAKRGIAYKTDISERVIKLAAKVIRMFDKHFKINEIIKERTDPATGELITENFPNIPGAPPAAWWLPRDDIILIKGLHKHGWDPRRAHETFLLIKNDKELKFTYRSPENDTSEKKDDAMVDDTIAVKREVSEIDSNKKLVEAVTVGIDRVKVEDYSEKNAREIEEIPSMDKQTKIEVKSETHPEATISVAKTENTSSEAQAAKDEAIGANMEVKDESMINVEGQEETTNDATGTAPEEEDDPNWPINHKLGLRAKRIVDWFRMQDKRKKGGSSSKPRSDIKPRRRKVAIVTEWSKSEKRQAYKGLLRYGMPADNPPAGLEEYFLTHEQFLSRCGMNRKSPQMLDLHLKLFIQDAMQMRINTSMPAPSRSADILTSSTSAKKLLERVNMLRDLRLKILIYDDYVLEEVITSNKKALGTKKKNMMPPWWNIDFDLGMLKGIAKHGAGSIAAHEDMRLDESLPFNKTCRIDINPNLNRPKQSESAEATVDDPTAATASDVTGPESDKPAPSEDDGKHSFPSVVDIMNRLRALGEIITKYHQQSYFRDKENGGFQHGARGNDPIVIPKMEKLGVRTIPNENKSNSQVNGSSAKEGLMAIEIDDSTNVTTKRKLDSDDTNAVEENTVKKPKDSNGGSGIMSYFEAA